MVAAAEITPVVAMVVALVVATLITLGPIEIGTTTLATMVIAGTAATAEKTVIAMIMDATTAEITVGQASVVESNMTMTRMIGAEAMIAVAALGKRLVDLAMAIGTNLAAL